MKKFALVCACLMLISALSACGGSASGGTSSAPMAPANGMAAPDLWTGPEVYDAGLAEKGQVNSSAGFVDSAIYQDPNAKVIRSAELTIQTTEFDQSVSALAALTEEQGGYYETAQVEGGGINHQQASRTAYYVVRVPKEHFTAFRDALGEVGHLYSITEDTKDVGETYYDTEARLKTLTAKRERLLALLEKAEVMEDIISLESALADVQYEIDSHTATLRKYDSLIDFSTFRIYLEEVVKLTQGVDAKESFGVRLGASFQKGLEEFGAGVEDSILWLARNFIGVAVFAMVDIAAVFGGRRVWRKRRAAKVLPPNDEQK